MGTFVIVKYHCEVAGIIKNTVDYQVRYFDTVSTADVINRLENEPPHEYKNCYGESVQWVFDEIIAVEINPSFVDGHEIIGFITESLAHIENSEQ